MKRLRLTQSDSNPWLRNHRECSSRTLVEKVSGIKPKEEEKSPLAVLCIDMKRRRSGISTPSCQKLSCNAQGDSSRHDVIAAGGAPSGIPGSVKGLACFDSQLGAAQAAEAGADALGRRKADAWNGGNGGPAIGSGYGYTSGAIGKSTCTTCSITLAACISGRAGSVLPWFAPLVCCTKGPLVVVAVTKGTVAVGRPAPRAPVQAAPWGQHATWPAWSAEQTAVRGQHSPGAPRPAQLK